MAMGKLERDFRKQIASWWPANLLLRSANPLDNPALLNSKIRATRIPTSFTLSFPLFWPLSNYFLGRVLIAFWRSASTDTTSCWRSYRYLVYRESFTASDDTLLLSHLDFWLFYLHSHHTAAYACVPITRAARALLFSRFYAFLQLSLISNFGKKCEIWWKSNLKLKFWINYKRQRKIDRNFFNSLQERYLVIFELLAKKKKN